MKVSRKTTYALNFESEQDYPKFRDFIAELQGKHESAQRYPQGSWGYLVDCTYVELSVNTLTI